MFTRDLELPRGPERERVWARDSDVTLRGSEVRTLAAVGAFRVVPAGDLRDGQDRPLDPHSGDLRHLRDSGLVETIPAIGNDRALVVLTERGRDVLERNRWSSVHREELKWAAVEREFDHRCDVDDERSRPQEPKGRQEFHVGIRSARHTRFAVHRPRELTHDAQVDRAYLKEAERLREEGAFIPRHPRSRAEARVPAVPEDGLLALAQHLPAEAAEAILELATGGTPRLLPAVPVPDPFAHPAAQRRFRVVTSVEELERALDAMGQVGGLPAPEQRQLVTHQYAGPARVAGSAGTGKTVVALNRAVHLTRANPDGRILLATFSEPLAHALRANVKRLIGNEPRVAERLEVHAMSNLGIRLHQAQLGPVRLASKEDVDALLREASPAAGDHKFRALFLRTEWDQVVDAWQLGTWEAYRDVQRLGRRTRLPEARRAVLWKIFEQVREKLKARGLMTESAVFQALRRLHAGT